MNDMYLIPANTNRGKLILGIFTSFDLILFGVGVFITIILMMFVPMTSTIVTVLILAPALVSALLVAPVPYYHNILTVVRELIEFFNNRQKYVWKGWCSGYGDDSNK